MVNFPQICAFFSDTEAYHPRSDGVYMAFSPPTLVQRGSNAFWDRQASSAFFFFFFLLFLPCVKLFFVQRIANNLNGVYFYQRVRVRVQKSKHYLGIFSYFHSHLTFRHTYWPSTHILLLCYVLIFVDISIAAEGEKVMTDFSVNY